jgi:hypothetical protein
MTPRQKAEAKIKKDDDHLKEQTAKVGLDNN